MTYGRNIEPYSSGQECMVRKIGNIVHIKGILTNKDAWTTHSSMVIIPEGFRPTINTSTVQQGSGSNRYCANIRPNGTVQAERYSNNETMSNTVPIGSWLNLFASWMV